MRIWTEVRWKSGHPFDGTGGSGEPRIRCLLEERTCEKQIGYIWTFRLEKCSDCDFSKWRVEDFVEFTEVELWRLPEGNGGAKTKFNVAFRQRHRLALAQAKRNLRTRAGFLGVRGWKKNHVFEGIFTRSRRIRHSRFFAMRLAPSDVYHLGLSMRESTFVNLWRVRSNGEKSVFL